jgi:ubiquinone/menaquinone biosynthesis C-methylase UbiE
MANASVSQTLNQTFKANLRFPLYQYSVMRSLIFSAESLFLPLIDLLVNRRRPRLLSDDLSLLKASREALDELLQKDIDNIMAGLYPIEVLRPESPIKHLLRIPVLFKEGIRAVQRRGENRATEFNDQAQGFLYEVPEYYRRNFHFQDSGYLSNESAELYEHQVEVLFAGAAGAMRRLLIKPLKTRFPDTDGSGLTFLELGAGTGAATRFVRLAFPKAKIVAVDLSAPYLKQAQKRLRHFPRHDFVEANASHLPFQNGIFDAVFSVFLFHELPETERREVMRESLRVLKEGGWIGMVDSLQLGDQIAFDSALEQFPRDYHEPFYKNYVQRPIEKLMRELHIKGVHTRTGFFSKVVWGEKAKPVSPMGQ